MGQYDDRPYEVGKGKPPLQHRWKKGQSGNPRGPRRKAKRDEATMTELLADIINAPVEVMFEGKPQLVTKKELILMKLVHDAAAGTPFQRDRAIKSLQEMDAFNLLPPDRQKTPEQQEAALAGLIEFLAEEARATGLYNDDLTLKDPNGC